MLGIQVQKYGRTTGLTVGTVDGINATVDVCYDSSCFSVARFVDQLVISPGTFSGGGDSGSLIVDSGKHPVGLLFAGSSTNTIANRIDLVLNRFGVSIDEGSPPPVIDVAVTGIGTPSTVSAGAPTPVTVTVENRGQQAVGDFTVTLKDLTEDAVVDTKTVSDPGPGISATVEFSSWTPTKSGLHTPEASHPLISGDENTANDSYTTNVNVVVAGPGTPQLQLRQVVAYTDRWTTVQLDYDYDSVAEHGVKMEAVQLPNFISSDHAGA